MNPAKKTPKTTDEAADAVALQAEIEILKTELERCKDLAGRSQADLQNAKDRLVREGEEMRKYAVSQLIERLLPTIDNFQRAFQHLPEDLAGHDWVKGVQSMEKELMTNLQNAGLHRLECIGQPVDPAKHEVLQADPAGGDAVVEVYEDGYELNGKVLRPAKVKVGDSEAVQ